MIATDEVFHVPPGSGRAFNITPGERIRSIALPRETGGFAIYDETNAPLSGPPLHSHRDVDESFYIMEGTYKIQVGERIFCLEPGGFVHIPRRTPHALLNVSEGIGRMLAFFTPRDQNACFADIEQLFARGVPPPGALTAMAQRHGIEVLGPPLTEGAHWTEPYS